jgi:hypothetical protein
VERGGVSSGFYMQATQQAFLTAHQEAFQYFGGVFHQLRYDNLTSAVKKILQRAERGTLIITTNLPFSEWPQVFPSARLCKALLDRITDRAHIIETGVESYRFKRTVAAKKKAKE